MDLLEAIKSLAMEGADSIQQGARQVYGNFDRGLKRFGELDDQQGLIGALLSAKHEIAPGIGIMTPAGSINSDEIASALHSLVQGGGDVYDRLTKPVEDRQQTKRAQAQNPPDVHEIASALVQEIQPNPQPNMVDLQKILQAAGAGTPNFKLGPNDKAQNSRGSVSHYSDPYSIDKESGRALVRGVPVGLVSGADAKDYAAAAKDRNDVATFSEQSRTAKAAAIAQLLQSQDPQAGLLAKQLFPELGLKTAQDLDAERKAAGADQKPESGGGGGDTLMEIAALVLAAYGVKKAAPMLKSMFGAKKAAQALEAAATSTPLKDAASKTGKALLGLPAPSPARMKQLDALGKLEAAAKGTSNTKAIATPLKDAASKLILPNVASSRRSSMSESQIKALSSLAASGELSGPLLKALRGE